jgi:hypothetical protein
VLFPDFSEVRRKGRWRHGAAFDRVQAPWREAGLVPFVFEDTDFVKNLKEFVRQTKQRQESTTMEHILGEVDSLFEVFSSGRFMMEDLHGLKSFLNFQTSFSSLFSSLNSYSTFMSTGCETIYQTVGTCAGATLTFSL